MQIANWGNFPQINTQVYSKISLDQFSFLIGSRKNLITRGNGISYGDSALNKNAIFSLKKNRFNETGMIYNYLDHELIVNSACSISDVLNNYWLKKIILPVIPNSKNITIGGAIAADIHGKNHYLRGSLSRYVKCLDLITASGDLISVSPESNSDLFWATCGGLGLTGVIVSANIQMNQCKTSVLNKNIHVCKNLDEVIRACSDNFYSDYLSAWIDLSGTGTHGRGVVFSSDFISAEDLAKHADIYLKTAYSNSMFPVPFYMYSGIVNHFSVKAFDNLFYFINCHKKKSVYKGINSFFSQLDYFKNWNRLFGHRGVIQYQFVVPSADDLKKIVYEIKKQRLYCLSSELRLLGAQYHHKGNLSFPMKGYSLSMDFKLTKDLFRNLDYLDEMVASCGGRVNLAKDSRMKPDVFRQMYGKAVDEFLEIKAKYDPGNRFNSLLAERLGLMN